MRPRLLTKMNTLFVSVKDLDIDAFLHCNDLTYLNNGEEELKKYNINDKIKVKVLEIKTEDQKIRVGLRQTLPDPLDWFNDKKINQIITVKIISSDNKGFIVRPEGAKWTLVLKNQIAINSADARPSRSLVVKELIALLQIRFTKEKFH